MAPTLFVRAYAATSLREYFATAFEAYFLKGPYSIKHISPEVYKKIDTIDALHNFNPETEEKLQNYK